MALYLLEGTRIARDQRQSGNSARRPLTIRVKHNYVEDPKAVDEGLKLWASMLATAVRRQGLKAVSGKDQETA